MTLSLLYLIEILHQTTTRRRIHRREPVLYLIEILHQTTTTGATILTPDGLYLIEILHQTTTIQKLLRKQARLYLIEILHQTTTVVPLTCPAKCCILSKFYIKPQHRQGRYYRQKVVSYRNSTSNHNGQSAEVNVEFVVSYRNSTSNHNTDKDGITDKKLYLIEILHQTTTVWPTFFVSRCCILSKFYIKPQLIALSFSLGLGCILSKFYIKPQHTGPCPLCSARCILSKFYIKPQRGLR